MAELHDLEVQNVSLKVVKGKKTAQMTTGELVSSVARKRKSGKNIYDAMGSIETFRMEILKKRFQSFLRWQWQKGFRNRACIAIDAF